MSSPKPISGQASYLQAGRRSECQSLKARGLGRAGRGSRGQGRAGGPHQQTRLLEDIHGPPEAVCLREVAVDDQGAPPLQDRERGGA